MIFAVIAPSAVPRNHRDVNFYGVGTGHPIMHLKDRDVTGFILAFDKPLWQATDLALISSMQMFEQGAFRFMLIDQENSSP